MKNKTTIITTLLCLMPILLSVVVYNQLPDQIAVHFDYSGSPDLFLPKLAVAFGLPVLFAALNLYTHFRVNLDPMIEKSSKSLRGFARWTSPTLSLILMPVTLFLSMGEDIPIVMIASILAGFVVAACGNYLPKCRRNYTIGIKLPWTLNNEENWNRTHRMAGFIWVVGGLVMIGNAFLQIPYVYYGVLISLVLLPAIYSFLFHSDQLRT